MGNLNNIPELRFPEFSGEWDNDKLGNLFYISAGGDIEKEHVNEVRSAKYQYPIYANAEKDKGLYGFSDIYKIKENVVTVAGRGVNIGIAHARNHKFYPIVRLLVLQPKQNEDIYFFEYQINRLNLFKESTGVPQLTAPQVSGYYVYYPKYDEQVKLASFFRSIDEKLQSLKKKKSLLKDYKNGVMQKLFSQELRFKDENGKNFPEWETKQVRDVFKVTRGNVLAMTLTKDKKIDEHIYPVYSSQTKNSGLAGYYKEYLFENAITWTTDGAGAGDVNYRSGKFYCTNVCGVLISDEGYANLFIAEILNSVSRKYVSYVGNPKLMNNVMAEIPIYMPSSISEQHKISNFLNEINIKMGKLDLQIVKTENWKRGLLQKMFC